MANTTGMPLHIKAKKHLGQNFLHDPNILGKITSAIAPSTNDNMVEIGPGHGALTTRLLDKLALLTVVEIDTDLISQLENISKTNNNRLKVIHHDALSFDFYSLRASSPGLIPNLRVVGNLPYNISTPLLFHLLKISGHIKDMHFLLQKEVVDRLAAGPHSKTYGRLSVMVQYYCKVEKLFHIPPGAFSPPPKVDSAFVRLTPWQPLPHPANNIETFAKLVRTSFSLRRKMLRKSLSGIVNSEVFNTAEIESDKRPENLSVADFVRLANSLEAS